MQSGVKDSWENNTMPQQDPYEDLQDDDYRRLRQSRTQSRFGNVDRSQLEGSQNILNTAVTGMVMGRQREIERAREGIEQGYISQNLDRLNSALKGGLDDVSVNKTLDETTLQLLRHGGTKSRQTASDIKKLRRTPKMDTSLTPEEAFLRGQIKFDTYQKMKQAGKTQPAKTGGWGQKYVNGKPATEKIGTKVHLVEEQTDPEGQRTGRQRLKGVTEARSSLLGFSSGGKGSLDLPFFSATEGKLQYRKVSGTPDDIKKQIKLSAKSIDETVRRFSQSKGKGFLPNVTEGRGFGAEKSWEDFLTDESVKIDDLPKEIRAYAAAYEELLTKLEELSGEPQSAPPKDESQYNWQFEEE